METEILEGMIWFEKKRWAREFLAVKKEAEQD